MNLQGDEPLMRYPRYKKGLNNQMIKNQSELGTLASEIKDIKFTKMKMLLR